MGRCMCRVSCERQGDVGTECDKSVRTVEWDDEVMTNSYRVWGTGRNDFYQKNNRIFLRRKSSRTCKCG